MSFYSNIRYESLLGGMIGGGVSTMILHPLDLLKVRFQVENGKSNINRPKYTGIFDAISKIVRSGGVSSLYRGLLPNVMGSSTSWGIYFLVYGSLKQHTLKTKDVVELNWKQHLSYASQAGVFTLLLANPIWVVKTRLILQYENMGTQTYNGIFHCMKTMIRQEGFTSLYKGFTPGLFGVSHGAIQFVVYEDTKKRYCKFRQYEYTDKRKYVNITFLEYLAFASLSKMIAVVTTYPYQVIRSRLQDQHSRYNGVYDVVMYIIRNEGMRGYYKGIFPTLIHMLPSIIIVMFVYENVSKNVSHVGGIRDFYSGLYMCILRVTPACCITMVLYENISGYLSQNSKIKNEMIVPRRHQRCTRDVKKANESITNTNWESRRGVTSNDFLEQRRDAVNIKGIKDCLNLQYQRKNKKRPITYGNTKHKSSSTIDYRNRLLSFSSKNTNTFDKNHQAFASSFFTNCFVLGMEMHLPNGDKTVLSTKLEDTEIYFLSIFCVEFILKVIAYGFLITPNGYLRNFWNIMDFIVVLTGLLSLSMTNFDQAALRAIRVLRPLRIVTGFESLQVVLKSIIMAMVPLLQIGVIVIFAILIFAIIGLEFYSGIFHKACRFTETGNFNYNNKEILIPCSSTHASGSYICPINSQCTPYWRGPNYGITSFDNIFYSMLTVFQCITMEGWTTILYNTNNVVGTSANFLYYIIIIILGSFFLLNLVLGVLSGEFQKERERVEHKRSYNKMRKQKQMEIELNGYLEWICRAEEVILNEDRTTLAEKKKIIEGRRRKTTKKMKFLRLKESNDASDDYDDTKLYKDTNKKNKSRLHTSERRFRLKIKKLVKSQFFYWCVIILVFLNTICIAVEHYNQPPWLSDFLHYAEFAFLACFVFEVLLKMYSLKPTVYLMSSFNKFDCAVIFGSVIEIIWSSFDTESSFGISVLRAIRLLRVFKITRYWASLRNLVISLLNSMRSIISLLFLLFLCMLIFALLGMQLFGGSWNFPEGKPAANFDTFIVSLLTVFQIIGLEDWNEIMYNGVRSQGGIESGGTIYSLYFVVLVIVGNYTLLNVFLAIAVDNLANAQELTDAENKKENKLIYENFEDLDKEMDKQMDMLNKQDITETNLLIEDKDEFDQKKLHILQIKNMKKDEKSN
ncbi:Mitochondrial folate transporter/carrier, partial [Intoshia linei]